MTPDASEPTLVGAEPAAGPWRPRGGGEMGARVRALDWAATAVGPLGNWPPPLRLAVELCLNSRFPMFVWWGPDLTNIYNDAYAPMLGNRHPGGLGRSARAVWAEAWDQLGPQVDAVLLRGESTWNQRQQLVLQRNGFPEECYFTWSYSPILDAAGRPAGLFCAVTEETARVLAERERDRSVEQLAAQYRRFERMLASITDLAFVFDLQGRFIFANRRLLDIWGITLDQASGMSFADLGYPPALAEKLRGQIAQVIRTARPLADELEFTDRRGHTGYYQYIYSPVVGADGAVEAVAGVTRELTERVRIQAERERLAAVVARERANLAAIIEQSPAFIAVLRGPDHVFELANERFYEISGRRDLIGRSVRDAFPDIARQGFYELLDRVYQTGQTFTADEIPIELARPDGSVARRYMKAAYQLLPDADPANSGVFVNGFDVTDMVLARQALAEREAFHRFSAEAGRTGSWNASLDTLEATFSPMMCQLVGLPTDQTRVSEAEWFARVAPEDRPGMRAAIAAAVDRGVPYECDFRINLPDGSQRWLASRGGVVRDPAGRAARLHGATVDITDKKRLAQERETLLAAERAARTQAEQASRAKDTFLAVLSHELRTPLSPVRMIVPAIEADPDLHPKFADDLAMVRRNIELEVKLIDDLLDLSRTTSGKLRLQLQPVRVHDLLRHVIRSNGSDAAAKRLSLVEAFAAPDDGATADPARLQQVFWNLIRNAIKFTPDGGRITIATAARSGPPGLVVEVRDTGVGIPPDVLPRVFEPFEQGAAGTTREFGGLGLGLAISKAVVKAHGGTITAASPGTGLGSTLRVELVTTPSAAGADAAATPGPAARPPAPDRTPRVLLVEDHADTSRTLARLLKTFGFDVTTAGTAAAALALLDAGPFDALVSDIGLPDATGYDLMRQARARHDIRGVALSGYGMEDDVRQSRDAGFSDHLVKPVDLVHLRAVLKSLTDRSISA